jgi:hypothetical protein
MILMKKLITLQNQSKLQRVAKMLSSLNFGSLGNLVSNKSKFWIIIPLDRKHLKQTNNKICFVCGKRRKDLQTVFCCQSGQHFATRCKYICSLIYKWTYTVRIQKQILYLVLLALFDNFFSCYVMPESIMILSINFRVLKTMLLYPVHSFSPREIIFTQQ